MQNELSTQSGYIILTNYILYVNLQTVVQYHLLVLINFQLFYRSSGGAYKEVIDYVVFSIFILSKLCYLNQQYQNCVILMYIRLFQLKILNS